MKKLKNTEKLASFSCRDGKSCKLFPMFPGQLQMRPKGFICIPLSNFLEMKPSAAFQSILYDGSHGNDDHYIQLRFLVRICKFYGCAKLYHHHVIGKKDIANQNFQIFSF